MARFSTSITSPVTGRLAACPECHLYGRTVTAGSIGVVARERRLPSTENHAKCRESCIEVKMVKQCPPHYRLW